MITAISAFAKDIIVDTDTETQITGEGGPAHWIKNAAEFLQLPLNVIAGEQAVTTIYIKNGSAQYGVLNSVDPISVTEPIVNDGFIINVMQDEFDLNQVRWLDGFVYLDIGSYTRSGKLGEVQQKTPIPLLEKEMREKIDCIKVNDLEYPFLPEEWKEEQKNKRILLHTLGPNGVEAWAHGKYIRIEPPTTKLKSTIGAGDTFGVGFVHSYLQFQDVEKASRNGSDLVQKVMNL